jgi:arsenate reductase
MKILFVCRANVGRSQMAAAFLNSLTKKHTAESAGFATGGHAGKLLSEPVVGSTSHHIITAMKEKGQDLSQNVRTQITSEMLAENDKVIVITKKAEAPDELQKSSKVEFWEDVIDMKGEPLEAHQAGRDQIEQKVKELIARL